MGSNGCTKTLSQTGHRKIYFWVHVDNEAVAIVLNTGKSREPELQNALREIAFTAASNEFVLKAKHIPGITNWVPDWLSRWGGPSGKKAV